MRFPLKYVASTGEEFDFMGDTAFWSECDVRDAAWSYTLSDGKLTRFTREAREATIPITVTGGLAERDRLLDLLDYDVTTKRPGRLYADEWYISCYGFSVKPKTPWFNPELMTFEAKFVLLDENWTKESCFSFLPDASDPPSDGLNYPHGYPHGYSPMPPVRTLDTGARTLSRFRMYVFGGDDGVSSPAIRIGANLYQVFAFVPAGGYMLIDSREKKIRVIDRTGGKFDAFDLRNKGLPGEGQYPFEPIRPGVQYVVFAGYYGFDIHPLTERSVPPWAT